MIDARRLVQQWNEELGVIRDDPEERVAIVLRAQAGKEPISVEVAQLSGQRRAMPRDIDSEAVGRGHCRPQRGALLVMWTS